MDDPLRVNIGQAKTVCYQQNIRQILPRLLATAMAMMLIACAGAQPGADSSSQAPDYIFHNGQVYTVDDSQPWASAVAVRGTDISYVGDDADVLALAGPSTRVINLQRQMLLPGFHDTHAHPDAGGLKLIIYCDLAGLLSMEKMASRLRESAADLPEGAWLSGTGWSTGSFLNGSPGKELLDDQIGRAHV